MDSCTRMREKRPKNTNNNENNHLIDDYENYQDDVSLNNQNSRDFMSNRKDSLDSNILGAKKMKINDPTFDLSKLNSFHSEIEKNFDLDGSNPKHIFGYFFFWANCGSLLESPKGRDFR
jgi:hypothetical protein